MTMQALGACVRKELLLLGRDRHGMLLLFVMPIAFILVMTLALQNEFAARAGKKIAVLVLDQDHSDASRRLRERLADSGAFALDAREPSSAPAENTLRDAVLAEGFAFAVAIAPGYAQRLAQPPGRDGAAPVVTLMVAPDTGKQTEMIFRAALRESLGRQRVDQLLAAVRDTLPAADAALGDAALRRELAVRYAFRPGAGAQAPSAVQQNVPAWLVFAVFFVAIPLSNTLIRERQLGTLRRLRSTPVGSFTVLAGKWITFFAVNQLQVVLMLAVGVYLMPLFGAQALQLQGSMAALALVAGALSVAALGYALLIAAATRTTEQATLLGGAGNIILAALGGIMVPKFVMPEAMQTATNISPMAWGLEGFLDVLLRAGGCAQVWPKAAALVAFGLAALLAAWLIQRRRAH